jgi:2-dehydropantoate 2-reductase
MEEGYINAVFNSICPLLDTDNGVFVHDQAVAELANEVVTECLGLTDRLQLGLMRDELMNQLMQISQGSDGQLISTLQDIRNGRETEIEFLNLEMARIAAAQHPTIDLPKTALLGRMTLAKSRQRLEKGSSST